MTEKELKEFRDKQVYNFIVQQMARICPVIDEKVTIETCRKCKYNKGNMCGK